MTREERMRYNRAANVIDYKMISRSEAAIPTIEQMEMLPLALEAMQRRTEETGLPLRKHIIVLQYHINHPTAILFKDRNTLDALAAGVMAIKWLIGQDNYDVNGVQI